LFRAGRKNYKSVRGGGANSAVRATAASPRRPWWNFSLMMSKPSIRIDLFREQRREFMKSFNWQDFLRRHPIFSSLTEAEIANLLRAEVAQERVYPQAAVILKEGEVGDSVFLIGAGSVQVTLWGTTGPLIPLAVLHAGEIFGEMAVLERKPRAATVVAREDCVLLEVAGEEIRTLLEIHPELQVKLYTVVRDRLKQASPQ
jgi:CRP-like cAMP-binding protein